MAWASLFHFCFVRNATGAPFRSGFSIEQSKLILLAWQRKYSQHKQLFKINKMKYLKTFAGKCHVRQGVNIWGACNKFVKINQALEYILKLRDISNIKISKFWSLRPFSLFAYKNILCNWFRIGLLYSLVGQFSHRIVLSQLFQNFIRSLQPVKS